MRRSAEFVWFSFEDNRTRAFAVLKQMKKSTSSLLGGLALGAAAVGAVGALIMKRNGKPRTKRRGRKSDATNVWARPGMEVIFRAELMPGRDASERTYHVAELLPSGRVRLDSVAGEHAQKEFEAAH